MAGGPPLYCIDTSAFIHAWVRAYPPDVLPALWDRLDGLVAGGVLIAPMDVLIELEKKEGDALFKWCEEREAMFREIDAFEQQIALVMGKYPRLVDTVKGKSGADPMVIALAIAQNPKITVITEENGGSIQRPRMPFVCQQEGIRCINVLQFIRDQGWKF